MLKLTALGSLCAALLGAAGLAQAPYGLTSRPVFSAFNGGALPTNAPAVSGQWSAVPAFPNLTFLNPMGIAQMPGTTKMVVWEREGRIYFFEKDAATSSKTLMLDLSNRVQGWDDSGLLALAFHPNFASNRYVFLYYTAVPAGTVQGDMNTRPAVTIPNRDRLVRYTVRADGTIDPASETIFIDQISQTVWHNGGGMFFHPDNGFLYLTNGDDSSGGNAQVINNGLHSGVLRIDVDQIGGSVSHPPPRAPLPSGSIAAHYYIPNDNPLVGTPGVLEEFFCIGLRSPHRMTIDPVTKRIFIGDVGQGSREEIDVIEPGESLLNFQWDQLEGNMGSLTPPFIGTDRRPLLDYTHSEGDAVIGGYVYRGSEFPDLVGRYLFGDNGTGNIYYIDESASPPSKVLLCTLPFGPGPNSGNNYTGLSSFGVDAANELYLCQLSSTGGRIYKLSRTGPPARQMPLKLSETGVLSDLASLTPATGFVAYDVNTPLWSDGAKKQRWFAVPSGQSIGYAPTGEWTFPDGSVFVKHFDLPTDDRDASVKKRLETRVLVRDDQGYVYGGSYKWRADGSDADLVTGDTNEDITITNLDGTTRTQTWLYPGRQTCTACHSRASGGVLGLNTPQNHRAHFFTETSTTDNQLRAWNHAGYFSPALDENTLAGLQKLAPLDDTSASIELRARSYLDANCSHCHRPGGVPALWDARIETPLDDAGIVDGLVIDDLGVSGAKVIAPADVARSIMHQRLATAVANYKMPPIAKNVVDDAAVSTLQQWIALVTSPPAKPLPAPWLHTDIGSVSISGSAAPNGNAFTINASGDDIWSGADSFHFIYRELTGDGVITARVLNVANTNDWAKAGVMIRETLAPGSKHAMVAATPANGISFQRRTTTNSSSQSTTASGSATFFVRLQRLGDNFIASLSPDGIAWTEIGNATISMTQKVKVGLCLTSHDNTKLGTASFDNITLASADSIEVTQPPQSQLSLVGESVTFDVATTGTTPTSFQWQKNAANIGGATSSQYKIQTVALAHAGAYRVVLNDVLASAAAKLAVIDEPTYNPNPLKAATATIEIPSAGEGITFKWKKGPDELTTDSRISGVSSAKLVIKSFGDADAADYSCVVEANGRILTMGPYHLQPLAIPAITSAAPPAAVVSGTFSWQLTSSEPGTSFTVTGLTGTGLTYNPATAIVSGTPTASGDFSVSVTPRNAAGAGTKQTYTLHIDALSDVFPGNYGGLITRDPDVTGGLGGRFTATVSRTGLVTGQLFLASSATPLAFRSALTGPLGGDRTFTATILRGKASPFVFTLTISRFDATVAGALKLGALSTAATGRHVASTTAVKPFVAIYNSVARLATPGNPSEPQGASWLRVTVKSNGATTIAGRLADGASISSASVLLDDANLSMPFFNRLYLGAGAISGTAQFASVASALEVSGALDWRKLRPMNAVDRTYASGFQVTTNLLGRDYHAPAVGKILLDLVSKPANAQIDFSGAGLADAAQGALASRSFRLTSTPTALFATGAANPCATTITAISAQTGVFSGTFKLKDGALIRVAGFSGIIVPGEAAGIGAFRLPSLPDANAIPPTKPTTSPILSGSVNLHAN